MSRKPMRRDLDPATIALIEEFLKRSFTYNHLLNYGGKLCLTTVFKIIYEQSILSTVYCLRNIQRL